MLRILTIASIFAIASPALAETPSYNYVTLSYQTVELDDDFFDVDGDGFGISGSFEVAPNWHIVGGYQSLGFDFGVDLNSLAIGGGYHTDISPNASFYADLLWIKAEVEADGFGSADEDGYGLSVGMRGNIGDKFELEGGLSYSDLGDGADGTAFSAAGWYKFSNEFSIGLLLDIDEDVNGYGLGGRFYF